MKLRTHFIIAKIAAEHTGFTFWEKTAFCIGSLIPDLSPMQFVHRHFYAKSGKYVQKKLEQISGRNSLFTLLVYGKMAHYVSDFCCSVHSGGAIGNIREHIQYERALNCYAFEKYDLLKSECESRIEQQDLTSVLDCYHHSQKYDFHTDLNFAVRACVNVCMKVYYPRKTQAAIQSGIGDGGVYYSCRNSSI